MGTRDFSKNFCHSGQPSLSTVVTNCDKRNIGTSGGFGYKSQFDDMDISLMDSALLAHWACSNNKPKKNNKYGIRRLFKSFFVPKITELPGKQEKGFDYVRK